MNDHWVRSDERQGEIRGKAVAWNWVVQKEKLQKKLIHPWFLSQKMKEWRGQKERRRRRDWTREAKGVQREMLSSGVVKPRHSMATQAETELLA